MTYRLNVCNLSGTFEKSFGLVNFAKDYYAVLGILNAAVEGVTKTNSFPLVSESIGIQEQQEAFRVIHRYRLFCKLSHFFDDFNAFINKSLDQTLHYSKQSIDRRLHDFIRRVESMKIPQQTKDTIAGFLKMQRAKVALVAIRESPWVVPNLLENENLQIIAAKAKNEEVRKRLIMTTQILQTWGKFPELRLGQLISNSIPEGTDLFYVTDDKLIQLLRNFELQHDNKSG
jgi:hypothetical protein